MFRHYVYLHLRNDTGEVFYVGKGSLRSRQRAQVCERAHSAKRRSRWWQSIVSKHGYTVVVFASCETDEEAQRLEKELIAAYGRADLGHGQLVNLTDGGDGHAGIVTSADLRMKRSKAAGAPRSENWKDSIRRARRGGGNGGVVKHGDKLPPEWCASLAAAKVGPKNPMFGRRGSAHPRSRPVRDEASGATYASTTAAAAAVGMRMQTLHNMLTGFRPNSTSMRFA